MIKNTVQVCEHRMNENPLTGEVGLNTRGEDMYLCDSCRIIADRGDSVDTYTRERLPPEDLEDKK